MAAMIVALGAACFDPLSAASVSTRIRTERVFGPETATGRYKHPVCITDLRGGDLFIAYYGGDGEYSTTTSVFGSRRARGGYHWSKPQALAHNPMYAMGNPVVWQAPDTTLWLFFVVRPGETWSSSRIMAKTSKDEGRTWTDPFVVTWEAGTMVRGRPITVPSGQYLLPVYHETGDDPEFTAPDTSSFFLLFDPKTRRWTESNRVRSRIGNLQPAVALLDGNHLLAMCRRAGDYVAGHDGFVVRTESTDGGKTWSSGVETEFPNPNAAVELLRLANGHLLFVFNNSMTDRTPLTAAISTDNGRSFAHRRNLAEGPGDFGYPTAIQTPDGKIHVTYTSDERSVIRHAVFDESAVLVP
ncbi:MAG: exo-alpha-sialidase [Verrucomicrobia bacterium]|nr:exo-alpha-sialidase [Verrucomicrobiota bacterium]MBI3871142.1 exo-alpha-sialidase [Verrucomicrobiota bacterium]